MSATILIADDSKTVRYKVRKSFENHFDGSCQLIETENGADALKWLASRRSALPDVILLDRNMPIMTGDDTIHILKSDQEWKRIPVMILTTHGELEEIVKGLSVLQADDYLAKPFEPTELVARSKVLIRIKKAEDRNREYNAELQKALANEKRAFEELKSTRLELAETQAMAEMTNMFEKFVPKQFLERIAPEGVRNIEFGKAESTFFTILFSDIRSFTTLSENITPQELLNFLNSYFERMSGSIRENHGFVDKFIGDAIMALFDHPSGTDVDNANSAVQAAIGMQNAIHIYNQHRANSGYSPISIGVGIHSGPIVLGTVGWENRMDSTVLGDNVNLASRIENLTKSYGASILISDSTFRLLKESLTFQCRELDWVHVKGKSQPVGIYEVLDALPEEIREKKHKAGIPILAGLAYRRLQKWDQAARNFKKALEIYPDDKTARLQLKRLSVLRTRRWPKDWDGAIRLNSK